MVKAVVEDGVVSNLIEIEETEVDEYCMLAGCQLFDTSPWGLIIGDVYSGNDFWREGQRLPAPEEPDDQPDAAAMEAALSELGVESSADLVEQARIIRTATQKAAQYMPDDVAVAQPRTLYDAWAAGCTYESNALITHKGVLYRTAQSVTALEHQPPGAEGMLAVYRPVDALHTGTLADPIPFVYGMDCDKDMYYSEGGAVYLCMSDMRPCIWSPGTAGVWQWQEAETTTT